MVQITPFLLAHLSSVPDSTVPVRGCLHCKFVGETRITRYSDNKSICCSDPTPLISADSHEQYHRHLYRVSKWHSPKYMTIMAQKGEQKQEKRNGKKKENHNMTKLPGVVGWEGKERETGLDSLPATIVDVSLELASNEAGNALAEPEAAQHRVVALLVEEELAAVAEAHVHLAVLVDKGRGAPRAAGAVEVKDGALADIDEQADILLASVCSGGQVVSKKKLLRKML